MKQRIMIILLVFLLVPLKVYSDNHRAIVTTHHMYSFDSLMQDVKELKEMYPELISVKKIGQTNFRKPIIAVKVGKGEKSILIHAAHHGREWITSMIVMKMIEEYAEAHKNNVTFEGYDTSILDRVSIWFVPMVNPDGVTIQQEGFMARVPKSRWELFLMNGGSTDFSRWKANGNGVDLNRQYPAGWEDIAGDAPYPFYQLYKGEKPISSPEVIAMTRFTKEINPLIALAYHSSGRVLYWYYNTKEENINRDKAIAMKISEVTGYELSDPVQTAVGGGFTDWFIQRFKRPAITVEVGYPVNETSPPLTVFPSEWRRNKTVGLMTAYEAEKISK
ncbi:M14 family metallocarboxypeptidase [Bacillus salitolerans]|uniref:M14 family metallocarboxypeptidase n=1 Tax=Bacillus salitolerans TaxID=1437434 RepID=A0ABW4LV11_9BACI